MHAILPDHYEQCRLRQTFDVGQLGKESAGVQESSSRHTLHHPGLGFRGSIVELSMCEYMASLKKNVFACHPRMHDEVNFATLDWIYEQVMRGGEEKLTILFIMDEVTASLNNSDV
jgi:hypothetical protein